MAENPTPAPKVRKPSLLYKLRAYSWSALPSKVFRKILAIILSLLFLIVSLLFLGYSAIQIITNTVGIQAQVADVSSLPNTPVGKYRLVYEGAGLFKAAVVKDHVEYEGVYCLYPAWPNYTEPNMGDQVKVWPEKKPLVAALPMQGKGWIVSVFFLFVGLVMFEFFLLAWTIH
jgi:hypothetical protein